MEQVIDTKKKIILVEDDADLRIVYSTVLINEGFDVKTAPDGEVGLDMIRKNTWDLILLDIMLPKVDGIDVLKITQNDHLKKGKIVVLTNLNNENIIQEIFKHGADGYITKSEITPGSLVEEVKGYLQNPA